MLSNSVNGMDLFIPQVYFVTRAFFLTHGVPYSFIYLLCFGGLGWGEQICSMMSCCLYGYLKEEATTALCFREADLKYRCPVLTTPPSCRVEDGSNSSIHIDAYQNQGSLGAEEGI